MSTNAGRAGVKGDGDSLVVRSASRLFDYLWSVTLAHWVMERVFQEHFFPNEPQRTYVTEVWVAFWTAFPFLVLLLPPLLNQAPLLFLFPIWKFYELVVKQTKVILFDPRKDEDYKVHSRTRLVILAFLNYLEVVLWTAVFFFNFSGRFDSNYVGYPGRLWAIYTGIQVVSGWGAVIPRGTLALAGTLVASSVGIFMTVIVVARVIGLIGFPESMDPREPGRPQT